MAMSEIKRYGLVRGCFGTGSAPADKLAATVNEILGQWRPGDPVLDLVLTGPGPVWGYLAIAHAAHGRAARCTYAAPNATIVLWNHGL